MHRACGTAVSASTLRQIWNQLTPTDRHEVVTVLGAAIRALHRVEVPIDLRPPWLSEAPTLEPRDADQARNEAALWQAELAALLPGPDRGIDQERPLLDDRTP